MTSLFDLFAPTHAVGAARHLELHRYIEREDVAVLTRDALAGKLSTLLVEHVLAHILRRAKRKPGRPRKGEAEARLKAVPATASEVEALLRRDGYVDAEILVALVRPFLIDLSEPIAEHIIAHIRRQARRKPGPGRSRSGGEMIYQAAAELIYESALAWYQSPPADRPDWQWPCDPSAFTGAPFENALELVRAEIERYRRMDPPALANLLSKLRSERATRPPIGVVRYP